MNHSPGCVGISALSRMPSTTHLRPIFWMLPSAFSSIVVRPPAMLPLVGCESDRSLVLWRLMISSYLSHTLLDFARTPSLRPRPPTRGAPPPSAVVSADTLLYTSRVNLS